MSIQIVSAIQIAYDPAADPALKRQAFDYVNQLRQEPSAWQPCLSFYSVAASGSGHPNLRFGDRQ